MSSMRSASSRTRISMCSRVKARRARRSSRRPGVATRMSARRAARACFSMPTPPYTAATVEPAGGGDGARLVDDLRRRARGSGRGRARAGPGRPAARRVDDRHGERQRLAGPGGRLGEHVVPGQDVGDDEALDGERLFDAARGERAAHGIGHAEIGEGLLGQGKWLLAAHGPRTVREATADPKPHESGTQASCLAADVVSNREISVAAGPALRRPDPARPAGRAAASGRASIWARCGSSVGGRITFEPSSSSGTSTVKPGPSSAISKRTPPGSRK